MDKSTKKGWEKIHSRITHQNPWYHVREDDVLRLNGTQGKYFVVGGIDSIAVVAKDQDGAFYWVDQSRYPIGNISSRELVTGGMNTNDNPLDIAKKELKEEIGATANQWRSLGYIYPASGYLSEKCYVFLATDLNIGESSPEATEDISIVKLSEEEIVTQIHENKIMDAISIASFYKYLLTITQDRS